MLTSETLTIVLHAVSTGDRDAALNVITATDEIDDETKRVVAGALSETADSGTQASRLGDALRSLGAGRNLVNECYRVSFYAGEEWKQLTENQMFAFFVANRAGQTVDKWVHYFPIFERHLARYRGRAIRVLEIGVFRGGGLELLRHYLGSQALLVGIDIDMAARLAVGDRYPVEIGDQEDPVFLSSVAEKHGPFDVVIDDGGHTMRQQIVSVESLFPLLSTGGTYLVEDCHTSYWPEYADPDPAVPTFIEWLKQRVDDIHAYHHSAAKDLQAPWQTTLSGIHVYDSVTVLEKDNRWAPFSEITGTSEFINYGRDQALVQLEMRAARDAAIAAADARTAEADARAARVAVEAEAIQNELAHTRDELVGSWGIIEGMRRSRSWRLTSPLRRIKSLLTGR